MVMRGAISSACIAVATTACLFDDGTNGTGGDLPAGGDCDATADWMQTWANLEAEVLDIVNMHRAQGADCGSEGMFGPAPALSMQSNLQCAARLHSMDMAQREFFDHVNPDGEDPWDRFERAGYVGFITAGENIAAGNADAQSTMQQWMESDGHCRNIMKPDFNEIGVGYYPGGPYGHVWTQGFGAR